MANVEFSESRAVLGFRWNVLLGNYSNISNFSLGIGSPIDFVSPLEKCMVAEKHLSLLQFVVGMRSMISPFPNKKCFILQPTLYSVSYSRFIS